MIIINICENAKFPKHSKLNWQMETSTLLSNMIYKLEHIYQTIMFP